MRFKIFHSKMNFRYIHITIVFFGITVAFFARQNVGIALVAMTDKNGTDFPTFNWTFKEQQYILSSYNLGYVISQIPATFLLNYFGSKSILLVSIGISGMLQLVTPASTMVGSWKAFCGIRFVQVSGNFQIGYYFDLSLITYDSELFRNSRDF